MTIFVRGGAPSNMNKTLTMLSLLLLASCDVPSGYLGEAGDGQTEGEQDATSSDSDAPSKPRPDAESSSEDGGFDDDEGDTDFDPDDEGDSETGKDDADEDDDDEGDDDAVDDDGALLTVAFAPNDALGFVDILLDYGDDTVVLRSAATDRERMLSADPDDPEGQVDFTQPLPSIDRRRVAPGVPEVVVRLEGEDTDFYRTAAHEIGSEGVYIVALAGSPLGETFIDDSEPPADGTYTSRLVNLVVGPPTTWYVWTDPDASEPPIPVVSDLPYGGVSDLVVFDLIPTDEDSSAFTSPIRFLNVHGDPDGPQSYNDAQDDRSYLRARTILRRVQLNGYGEQYYRFSE